MRINLAGGEFIEFDRHGLTSNLKSDDPEDVEYNAAIDGMESLLLHMASLGIIYPTILPEVQEAVQNAVETITNNT